MRIYLTSICLLYLFLLTACQQPKPSPSPTPLPTAAAPTATATQTPTPTKTSTPTLLSSPTTAASPTPQPSNTPAPTPSPPPKATATATPTRLPPPTYLSIRQPTFEQLENYLQSTTVRRYSRESRSYDIVSLVSDPPKAWDLPLPNTQFYYEDVNADGEDDLLLLYAETFLGGSVYLIVMLWDDTAYTQPLLLIDETKLSASTKYYMEDLLGDEQPELVWMSNTDTSGSGYIEEQFDQYILQCNSECNIVWHTPFVNFWFSYDTISNMLGHGLRTTTFQVSDDSSQIRTITQNFSTPLIANDTASPMQIFDITEEVYSWTGEIYTRTASTIISKASDWLPEMQDEASNGSIVAHLEAEFIHGVDFSDDEGGNAYNHYDCIMMVNGNPTGDSFGCNPFFSQLSWQDVTADSRDELILLTLLGASQRMLVWQRWGEGYRQIADISGSINHADLSDMVIKNVDSDPELEILAGRFGYQTNDFCFSTQFESEICWFEVTLDQVVYDWDGWQYVKSP